MISPITADAPHKMITIKQLGVPDEEIYFKMYWKQTHESNTIYLETIKAKVYNQWDIPSGRQTIVADDGVTPLTDKMLENMMHADGEDITVYLTGMASVSGHNVRLQHLRNTH
ncbi:hypothetical protein DdX_20314 [Ditylenchus destructor]|uniref:Uncharacterized protein n=1 Tax=Ditylenchus destructor TaxID=166010 RepID=A0AAD4MGJ5_9BILA|nr:hypothetical protein DdX_20314 [Ditylenchus destructor]